MVDDIAVPAIDGPWDRVLELTGSLLAGGRDAEVEAELPHLRLAAAEMLRDTVGRAPWPPRYEDPFPDVRGALPEIGPEELTADVVVGGILHHGAILVRGMLGPDDVDRVGREMDLTFESRLAADEEPAGAEEEPPWWVPFRPVQKTVGQRGKPHLIRVVDAPRVLADALDTYRRLGLIDLIGDYFGEPPVFTANKSVLRYLEVPPAVFTDFHQDGRFMGTDVRALNVWVTLTDCGTDAPSLDLIPRREQDIAPTGNGTSGFDWTIAATEADEMAGDTPVVHLDLRAGDGLLFDHMLVHRSGVRAGMTGMRKAIEWWFFAPSHVPWKYQPLRA